MDPLTASVAIAWAKATEAVAVMITEMIRGQTTEQKNIMWQWWIDFDKRVKKFFKSEE